MVNKESQAPNWDNQELHSECVMVAIIRCLELRINQVNGGVRTSNVDDLHAGVVEGNEGSQQVQVASSEHQSKQDLTLPRNTSTGSGLPYLEQQDDDGCEMGQITG